MIHFNLTELDVVLPVAAYAKADRDNMLASDTQKVVSHNQEKVRL